MFIQQTEKGSPDREGLIQPQQTNRVIVSVDYQVKWVDSHMTPCPDQSMSDYSFNMLELYV